MALISDTLLQLQPSGIRRFTTLAQQTPGCCSLTIGEPDFDTPEAIKSAAAEALAQGQTHYAPNQGTLSLRSSLAQWETRRGFPCSPEQILITPGATGALYTALTAILNPGDQVIIPLPAFPLYESIVLAAGAEPVFLDLSESGFQIDEASLRRCIGPRTKAMVINSPCNPTGVVLNSASLDAVSRCALEFDFQLVCDNVYMGLSLPGTPDITLRKELQNQIILCQSFSKPYAMTGWRIGYLAASEEFVQKFTLLQAAQLACMPTFVQAAAKTALATDVSHIAESFRQRREYVCHRLEKMGLSFPKPEGAFYVFPSIRHTGLDSETFCLRMIHEAGLAAVPGKSFGADGHIRLSCCYSPEALSTGLDRLEEFIRTL